MISVLLPVLVLILLMEGGMWYLFRKGAVRICIPSSLLVLRKPRVTMAMLHMTAVIHTIFLLTAVILAYIYLW